MKRNIWPWVPVVLLTAMVGGLLTLAHIAADDPSFAVERDYYAKAVAWDAHRLQERENVRLGWQLSVDTAPRAGTVELVAELVDRTGTEIRGAELAVEAFHNARAGDVLAARLKPSGAGYRAELPMRRAGIWELRFTATRGAEKFTEVVRTELEERPQ